MNRVTKTALINLNNSPYDLKIALFHSTPVLHRRRRTYWDSAGSFNRGSSRRTEFHSRRHRKLYSKQELLRNVNAFTENLFQGWHGHDEFDPTSSQGSSWFNYYGSRGFNGSRSNRKGPQVRGRRNGFRFCDDDDDEDVETIFRAAFGGNGGFYFRSFINDEPQRSSSGFYNNHQNSWGWRRQFEDEDEYEEDEYESSSQPDRREPDLKKDRIALGLSGSGPLCLEDVKNAYRVCALKWHPDRHEGSSKVAAEEKFKICSAAYQSICDRLTPN